jgi:hypothetical protein
MHDAIFVPFLLLCACRTLTARVPVLPTLKIKIAIEQKNSYTRSLLQIQKTSGIAASGHVREYGMFSKIEYVCFTNDLLLRKKAVFKNKNRKLTNRYRVFEN